MKSFLKNSSLQLKIGLLLLFLVFTIGFILPLFNVTDPERWNTYIKNLKPSAEHIMGTNALGQDIFWLLAKAIQNSLIIGLIVAFCSAFIGLLMGLLAGFRGGFADRLITLFADTFIVVPVLPVLILMGSLLKGRATVLEISAVLTLFNWSWPARQVRAMTMSLREREFIDTARFSGKSQMKILIQECMPYIISLSMASIINTILAAIKTETILAVIGLSNNTKATLGTMIYWANSYSAMMMGKWIWIGAPVVATVVIFIALFMTLSGFQRYNALKRGANS